MKKALGTARTLSCAVIAKKCRRTCAPLLFFRHAHKASLASREKSYFPAHRTHIFSVAALCVRRIRERAGARYIMRRKSRVRAKEHTSIGTEK